MTSRATIVPLETVSAPATFTKGLSEGLSGAPPDAPLENASPESAPPGAASWGSGSR